MPLYLLREGATPFFLVSGLAFAVAWCSKFSSQSPLTEKNVDLLQFPATQRLPDELHPMFCNIFSKDNILVACTCIKIIKVQIGPFIRLSPFWTGRNLLSRYISRWIAWNDKAASRKMSPLMAQALCIGILRSSGSATELVKCVITEGRDLPNCRQNWWVCLVSTHQWRT